MNSGKNETSPKFVGGRRQEEGGIGKGKKNFLQVSEGSRWEKSCGVKKGRKRITTPQVLPSWGKERTPSTEETSRKPRPEKRKAPEKQKCPTKFPPKGKKPISAG